MNTKPRSALLLASFILALVSIKGCKTTHVVHIHNGKPVEGSETVSTTVSDELLPIDITMILDRSGSMGSLTGQVITSYNDFLDEQKTLDGEATVSLVQFNHLYSPVYAGIDIQNANQLSSDNYVAEGSTALFDAIGRTIVETKERITRGSADVIFVITTDGLENSSQEFSGTQIKDMIAECESQFGWHFMYLAANDDAFNQYKDMGMDARNCLKLEATPEGWNDSQIKMSQQLMLYRIDRNPASLEFQDENHKKEDKPSSNDQLP